MRRVPADLLRGNTVQRTLIMSACLALVALLGPTGATSAQGVEPVSSDAPDAALRSPGASTLDLWDWNITGAGIVEGAIPSTTVVVLARLTP